MRRRDLLLSSLAWGLAPVGAGLARGRDAGWADEVLPPGVTPAPPGERRVGVAYSLWHYDDRWRDVWGTPELGFYASADRAVLRAHARWLAEAGVDFVLLDWSNNLDADGRLGRGSRSQLLVESATAALFEEFDRQPGAPRIAFLIGNPGAPGAVLDGRLSRKADQVHEQYAAAAAGRMETYLGKPLLVVYVNTPSPYQQGVPGWADPRFSVRYMTGFVSDQPALRAGGVSRFGYWSWEDRGPATFPVFEGHPEAMALAAAWRGNPRAPTPGRRGGETYLAAWRRARAIGPRYVLAGTWNEWKRGEQPSAEVSKDLEPSDRFGRLYLEILARQADLFRRGA